MSNLSGVLLPVVTPFHDNAVDYESYIKLLTYYKKKSISGFIPLGTTGESPCISDDEYKRIIDTTLETVDGQLPVYAGIGGNFTDKVVERIREYENTGIVGILSVCPYYNRPDQEGLYQHFKRISESTDLDIIIYNIPYRTGVNMSNDTLLRLSECDNIVGVKDSCGDIKQSLDSISQKPDGFAVLTGEDHLFYTTVVNGGDGGILAAAHLYTDEFIDIYKCIERNDHKKALGIWNSVKEIIPHLFREPNPGPLKYCLSALDLIRSSETRAPLRGISDSLQKQLDVYLKNDRSKMIGY